MSTNFFKFFRNNLLLLITDDTHPPSCNDMKFLLSIKRNLTGANVFCIILTGKYFQHQSESTIAVGGIDMAHLFD